MLGRVADVFACVVEPVGSAGLRFLHDTSSERLLRCRYLMATTEGAPRDWKSFLHGAPDEHSFGARMFLYVLHSGMVRRGPGPRGCTAVPSVGTVQWQGSADTRWRFLSRVRRPDANTSEL